MKKHIITYSIILISLCLILAILPYFCTIIHINGDKNLEIEYQQSYEELGAFATLFNYPITVNIINEIDTSKLGIQEIIYQVQNKLGTIKKEKRTINIVDRTPPILTLVGRDTITIQQGDSFIEPGYTLIDNVDGDISNNVQISGKINTDMIGTYKLVYEGIDSSNNHSKQIRTINIIAKEVTYQDSYNEIDNNPRTWWSGNKFDHKRPLIGAAAQMEDLKAYNAYYLGPDSKIIYLTFDEGTNNTYVKEIMEVLNNNQVKATFFFCNNYMLQNPQLMKDLATSGHSIGNHTAHHEKMYQFATQDKMNIFIEEIRLTERTFFEITGQEMDKVYREPSGDWSYRSLKIMKDMGYKTYFWSADYLDWKEPVTKEKALSNLLARYHNGAIYLIHPKNKGNYEAMDQFIKEMKKLGYQFGLVKDIK